MSSGAQKEEREVFDVDWPTSCIFDRLPSVILVNALVVCSVLQRSATKISKLKMTEWSVHFSTSLFLKCSEIHLIKCVSLAYIVFSFAHLAVKCYEYANYLSLFASRAA